jgi:hypothetical protein
MHDPIDLTLPCARQSLAAGEQIAGTATADVEHWLLIEHRGRWARDIAGTEMPDRAHQWLAKLLNQHGKLRPQLIRRNAESGPLMVYLVTTGPAKRVRRFAIASHDELASLPIAAILAGDAEAGEQGPPSLFLVCTHGRRDLCCARYGVAFHKTLEVQAVDGEVWQSSHQGGHRFAATMVCLPSGVHYGRLLPEEAEMVVAAQARAQIYALNRYRGQTRLSTPVQTAEAWLRHELGLLALDAVEVLSHELLDPDRTRWAAHFRAAGQLHRVIVEPRAGDVDRKKSCEAETAEPARWFYVVRHEAQTF